MRLTRPTILAAVGLFAAALVARPRLRNWGATPRDRYRRLPGDGRVPGERGTCTMAIDISAPAAAIWPWLAQMGVGRGGWYSWDRLDNGGHASARVLNPEWTEIHEGDRLPTVPGRSWFDVVHVEPNRSLVLRSSLDRHGRPFDPADGRPRAFVDGRWEFFLDERHGTTRLLARAGGTAGPRPLTDLVDWLFGQPAHLVMQHRQLHQLRARAELTAQAPSRNGG